MNMKDAYRKKMRAQLDEWSAEIDKLQAKATKLEANAQLKSMKEIDDLRAKRDDAMSKLNKLEQAGDDAWEDLKTGVESAWEALSRSVKSASAHFK